MIYPFAIPIFLFGLAIGSFLNCVIYRLSSRESFLKGFSHCPHCRHKLSWTDLIPILSFLILKEKCRYCKKPISLQYPLVELVTAVLFVSIWLLFGGDFLKTTFYLLISCFLIIIFVYDLKHYLIPDKIVYSAVGIAFLYRLISNGWLKDGVSFQTANFCSFIYSALGAAGFFFLIWFFSKGKWLGFGDVKLAFLMGILLGFPGILAALFLAFFIGAIMGIGLIIASRKHLSSQVPFGPFLVSGTFLVLFFGDNLIGWYLNLLR